MTRLRRALSYGNVTATVAVFLALSGVATAVTLAPANSVVSGSIKDGEVKTPDIADNAVRTPKIAPNSVGSGRVADGSLTGADVKNGSLTGSEVGDDSLGGDQIREASLGDVPAATLGGFGRYGSTGSCDPETEDFTPCSVVSINLEHPARVLVIGTVRAEIDEGKAQGYGSCRIGTTAGPVPASTDTVFLHHTYQFEAPLTVMAVTGVFPAGQHSFGVDCNRRYSEISSYNIRYPQARVSAVALSAD